MTDFPPPETTPLATERFATGAPRWVEASLSSSALAATAAARIFGLVRTVDWLPPMPPVESTIHVSVLEVSWLPALSLADEP